MMVQYAYSFACLVYFPIFSVSLGNCFFDSLAFLWMASREGGDETKWLRYREQRSMSLRRDIVEKARELRSQPDFLFQPSGLDFTAYVTDESEFDEWCTNMSKNCTWADGLVVQVAPYVVNQHVIIIPPFNDPIPAYYTHGGVVDGPMAFNIAYIDHKPVPLTSLSCL
jgi:hypothetical protein